MFAAAKAITAMQFEENASAINGWQLDNKLEIKSEYGVSKKMATKKAKAKNDAIMTGILVTRFKMGQINVEDLEKMAVDTSKTERCSAAKRVLDGIRDAPTISAP
jgi:hypothetical protein